MENIETNMGREFSFGDCFKSASRQKKTKQSRSVSVGRSEPKSASRLNKPKLSRSVSVGVSERNLNRQVGSKNLSSRAQQT